MSLFLSHGLQHFFDIGRLQIDRVQTILVIVQICISRQIYQQGSEVLLPAKEVSGFDMSGRISKNIMGGSISENTRLQQQPFKGLRKIQSDFSGRNLLKLIDFLQLCSEISTVRNDHNVIAGVVCKAVKNV